MIRFAQALPDEQIVSAPQRRLSWTPFQALVCVDEPLKRDFYSELCRVKGWSSRQLQGFAAGATADREADRQWPQGMTGYPAKPWESRGPAASKAAAAASGTRRRPADK